MKRTGNLYTVVCSKETIRAAIKKASKGKRKRRDVRAVLENIDEHIDTLHEELINENVTLHPYQTGIVWDGIKRKVRIIHKPDFWPDQVIHWCVYLAIKKYIYACMYVFSCGSIPGRGIHYGKRYINRWVRNDKKNTKYYFKGDIKKYYPSIDLEKLKEKLNRKFKDKQLMRLIEKILGMLDVLPIGMLLSQVFANFYFMKMDYFIKQELQTVHYMRYMDDIVLFGRNKKELHKARGRIEEGLKAEGLTLKENWQVCKLDAEPLDFMGFRFYRDKTTLRRSIMLRITRAVKRVFNKGDRATPKDASGIISYLGWIKHTDSHGLFEKWIKPFLRIGKMKNIIRRAAKNENI